MELCSGKKAKKKTPDLNPKSKVFFFQKMWKAKPLLVALRLRLDVLLLGIWKVQVCSKQLSASSCADVVDELVWHLFLGVYLQHQLSQVVCLNHRDLVSPPCHHVPFWRALFRETELRIAQQSGLSTGLLTAFSRWKYWMAVRQVLLNPILISKL